MSQNICPNCNHENRKDNKFCTQCGTKLHASNSSDPSLHILTKDQSKIVIPIKAGRSTIGRNIANTIVIDDELISSYHAVVIYSNNTVWVEDLESRNGIFLNGIKIEERTELHDGCIIKLGSTMLRYQATETPG